MKRTIAFICGLLTLSAMQPVRASPFDPRNSDLVYPACGAATAVQASHVRASMATAPTPSPTPASELAQQRGAVVNKTTIAGVALQSTAHHDTYSAISSVPGVVDTQTKTNSGSDSLQIRGIKLDNSASYRLDGALVMNNQINLPIEDKCRVEVLKGAGALEYGLAPPAGIVNYVMKRATLNPVASIGYIADEYGEAIGTLDIGRRFGNEDQFGYRVNLASGSMGAVASGAGGTRYAGGFTGDWYIGSRGAVQLDFEQVGINLIEQSSLLENKAVHGVIPLPNASRINPENLLSGGAWSWSRGWEQNFAARFGYELGSNSTFVFQAGRSEADRPNRFVTQIGSYNIATGAGTETVTDVQDQDYVNDFYDAHVAMRGGTSWLANEVTVGFNENQRDFNDPVNPSVKVKQNIYDPGTFTQPVFKQTETLDFTPQFSHDADPYISDSATFDDRLRFIAGVRQIQYTEIDAAKTTGTYTSVSSTLAPAGAIVYDFSPNFSAYASYVESLQETGQAPASAVNAYEVLPPEKAQQKEVGIRGNDLGILTPTLAYFRISEANPVLNAVTNYYALDGTTTYEGLETTDDLAITKLFHVDAGGILERAVQFADDPTVNGLTAENVPHFTYRVGFAYTLPLAREWTIDGDRSYASWRELDAQDQGTLPAVALYDAGVRWLKLIEGRQFELSILCRNLLDTRYFSSAYSGNLGIGAPRTITVNMRVGI